MIHTLSLLLGLTVATARTPTTCIHLVRSSETNVDFSASELNSAREWMSDVGVSTDAPAFVAALHARGEDPFRMDLATREDQLTRFVLKTWDQWRQHNQLQRDAALGLELRRLSPRTARTVTPFDGNVELTRRSHVNLARYLRALDEQIPLPGAVNAIRLARIERLADEVVWQFVRAPRETAPSATDPRLRVRAPLASARELHQLSGVVTNETFYSRLVDHAPSVEFDLLGQNRDMRELPPHWIQLDDSFADDAGFFGPGPEDALALVQIVQRFAPEAVAQTLGDLRLAGFVPFRIANETALVAWLTSVGGWLRLPDRELFARLAPLRERLGDGVLTTDDGREFLRTALVRYLLQFSEQPDGLVQLNRDWRNTGFVANFIRTRFLPAIGWENMRLRIPLSVPPEKYTVRPANGPPYLAVRRR